MTDVRTELMRLDAPGGGGYYRSRIPCPEDSEIARAVQAIGADVLVVGSPAYRASFTGLFKLFFDHIDQYALTDTEVILTATGGSDRHALLVEHQMRPLFGFFQAHTLPLGIYASAKDFTDGRVSSIELQERIDSTIERAVPLVLRSNPTSVTRLDAY